MTLSHTSWIPPRLRATCDPLLIIMGTIVRPVVYAATSVAIIAYIYTSYPLQHISDIPFAQITVRQLVNSFGFVLAMLFVIILGGGIIRASFSNDVDQDRGYLLVVLALVFLFQRSEEFMTLGGDALRTIGAIVAWLNSGFVSRVF
jgi:hypothetical protein